MPVYNTNPVRTLAIGQQAILSNASLGGANATQQVAIAQMPGNPSNLTVINGSTATLTVQVSATDASAATYYPLTGISVPASSALSFSTTAPFMRVLPSADPGTGVITVCR
jgi:hypothetical protein